MSGEKTFGAWLLEQQARQDTTGTLARAWYALKEARGYNRHTRAKSIRELMSSSLGEDWTGLHGNEAMDAAEKQWKEAEAAPVDYAVDAARRFEQPELSVARELADAAPPPAAVLTFMGYRYELTPGRTYELVINPVLREVSDEDVQDVGSRIVLTGEPNTTVWARPDGGYDWEALYALADRDLPEFFDLRSLPEASE